MAATVQLIPTPGPDFPIKVGDRCRVIVSRKLCTVISGPGPVPGCSGNAPGVSGNDWYGTETLDDKKSDHYTGYGKGLWLAPKFNVGDKALVSLHQPGFWGRSFFALPEAEDGTLVSDGMLNFVSQWHGQVVTITKSYNDCPDTAPCIERPWYEFAERNSKPTYGMWGIYADWLRPVVASATPSPVAAKTAPVLLDRPREFDGFCNPCGGFRTHRIGCPTKRSKT